MHEYNIPLQYLSNNTLPPSQAGNSGTAASIGEKFLSHARDGNMEQLRTVLDNHPDVVNFANSYGRTGIVWELIDLKAIPLPGYSNGSLEPPNQFAAGFAMKKSVISGWAWYLRFQPETKNISTPRIGVEKKPRALK
eukprot:sb/3474534/